MIFARTDEQRMMQEGAERFIREQYSFDARQAVAASQAGWSTAHWQNYAELGWLALLIPEAAGGLGFAFTDVAVLLEAFGNGLVLEPFISTVVLGAFILENADQNPRIKELEAVATGALRLALAHDEPGERHQRGAATATARRTASGFSLTGTKTLVLDGPSADQFIVSAHIEGLDGLALFLMPADAAGLVRDDYPLIDATRACDLEFTSVELPSANLLAAGEAGTRILNEALDRAVLAQSAEALGAMETVLRLTAEYIKTRVQFGQPIGKFQALQHRMAEMFTQTESARSMLLQGLAALDAEPAIREAAVSATKVAISKAGFFVGAEGMQLHGGMGMTAETAVGHYFKRLVALEKTYGDRDWHLDRFIRLTAG
jgi:alkylation response protein AidB-like acyl-CoA dehydrogenase